MIILSLIIYGFALFLFYRFFQWLKVRLTLWFNWLKVRFSSLGKKEVQDEVQDEIVMAETTPEDILKLIPKKYKKKVKAKDIDVSGVFY